MTPATDGCRLPKIPSLLERISAALDADPNRRTCPPRCLSFQLPDHDARIRACRIAYVDHSHAYALFGMFTRSLESWPLSRWDCGLALSYILGKPDRRMLAPLIFRM
jgi:hypothetical protein